MTTTAVELAFDRETEVRLTRVWRRLEASYGTVAAGEVGVRPHVSLAVFRESAPRSPELIVDRLTSMQPFPLNLASVDVFASDEGVVFLKPEHSEALVRAHHECMLALGDDVALVHPYYLPENWVPHCTMAIGVPPTTLNEVADRCRGASLFGSVQVSRVSVVRYQPTAELFTAQLTGGRAAVSQLARVQRRRATHDDFDTLFAINEAALRTYVEATFGPWDDTFQREQFARSDTGAHELFLHDETPIGFWLVSESATDVFLERLSLLPEYQGRGIGSELIRELQSRARQLRLPLRLRVFPVNPARHLYARLGFLVIGTTAS
jgi:ribosomal protein S18 acetylase RimI-like enzyme/2'-5' RNA ligase